MKISAVAIMRTVPAFLAGLLFGCGGGYGGGGSDTPATLSIAVNPTTINVGGSATITWNSNGSSCTASGAWSGTKAASGSEMVSPGAAGTYVYSMRCRGGGYGESQQGSATLTVNTMRAAGLWTGEACCIDTDSFRVAGMTNEAGDYRFMLLDTHFVGRAGRPPVAYAISDSSLAGQRQTGAPVLALLDITPGVAVRQWVHVPAAHAGAQNADFSVPYDAAFLRATAVRDLQGSFTSNVGSGYTLTLTFDAAGRITGDDTNGCRLNGRASTPHPTVNDVDLVLDVSGCGASNGRYTGSAALLPDDSGRISELVLSTSNRDAAIGWHLTR